jgi:methylmalonyl-CoA mutase cobalamin-binding subunit
VIPDEDRPELERHGYKGIFGPDTPTGTIVDFVRKHARARG